MNSRYYNPEWGRFINADAVVAGNGDLLQHNMFAYCGNNPVNREDSSGYVWNIIGGALIGGVISGAISAVSQLATTGSVNWKSVGVSVLSGEASGALAASGFGLLGQVIGNAAISGASYSADTKLNGGELYAKNIAANMIIGGTFGALGGKGYMNKSGSVKAVINQTNKTIERELRRANYKYAQKAIGRAITSSFDTVYKEGIKTTARYTLTSIGSSGTSYVYSSYWAQTSPPIGDFPVYGQYAMAY